MYASSQCHYFPPTRRASLFRLRWRSFRTCSSARTGGQYSSSVEHRSSSTGGSKPARPVQSSGASRASIQLKHPVHLGQGAPQKVWILFQEHTISRWVECNNTIKALPQLATSLHNLLEPLVIAAATTEAPEADDAHKANKDADADADGEAKVIQQAAEDCLLCMLGQRASQLGVDDLGDLGLPQRDIDRMRAKLTPKDRTRERVRQASGFRIKGLASHGWCRTRSYGNGPCTLEQIVS